MLKQLIIVFSLAFSIYNLAFPGYARAQSDWTDACVVNDVATIKGIQCLINNVLAVSLRLLGIVLLVMLVVGGFKYLTAGGDPKAVDAAKSTITAAITGLVLAIVSWFVLVFIKQITGVDVTHFLWPLPD